MIAALAAGAVAGIGLYAWLPSPHQLARGTAGAGTAPQVQVAGNELVSGSGQRVVLRGVDRSGTEYECVQGHGIFDGPSGKASVTAMRSRGINAVRVPLNEACWNGLSYVNPAYAGARYRAVVQAYVKLLNASGMVAILDLHWTDGAYTGNSSACSSADRVAVSRTRRSRPQPGRLLAAAATARARSKGSPGRTTGIWSSPSITSCQPRSLALQITSTSA